MKNIQLNKQLLILGAICLLTFFCYTPSLQNQFTNWDDDYYVTNDRYIKALTADNLKVIFTEDITKNNYHPLCMLSLAINYHFSGMDPQAYYLTNIIIHILNVILMFFLVMQLCTLLKTDEKGKLFIAGFCALLFGIHPMHVESVSWIAERKDVLYSFFYFSGLICYLKYTTSNSSKWYWATFLIFVASCLSKPMAVVFPLSLLCLDFLLKRTLDKKLIAEKIIFFLTSLIFGGAAFYTQNKSGAIADFGVLTLAERIMYASYGYVMYLAKFFNPTYLSTFYPYPYRYINGNLPVIYYAAPFIAIAVPAALIYLAYKKDHVWFRVAAFGVGFFTANVIFVLQFISVGAAIMADRYSYVAYTGLVFMIVYFLYEIIKRAPAVRTALTILLLIPSGCFAYLCYERTFVWQDSKALLSEAIEKYPYRALLSYKWLGNYYADHGQYDSALAKYNVLVQLHAADAKVYENIGRIYTIQKDYLNATTALESASQLRADKHADVRSPEQAHAPFGASDLNGAVPMQKKNAIAPDVEKKVAAKGFEFLQKQQFEAAIAQYDVLIQLNPNNAYYYFYRGVAQFNKDQTDKAIQDWTKATQFSVKEVQQSAGYNLCVVYDTLNKDSMAVYYMEMAQRLGYKVDPDFAEKLTRKKHEQAKRH
jgi:tetratricopeptide (TPR) repeat protein